MSSSESAVNCDSFALFARIARNFSLLSSRSKNFMSILQQQQFPKPLFLELYHKHSPSFKSKPRQSASWCLRSHTSHTRIFPAKSFMRGNKIFDTEGTETSPNPEARLRAIESCRGLVPLCFVTGRSSRRSCAFRTRTRCRFSSRSCPRSRTCRRGSSRQSGRGPLRPGGRA